MSEAMGDKTAKKSRGYVRSLLKILGFLRAYPGRVSLAVGLLLINICIELTLPQVLGEAMNGLQRHVQRQEIFSPMLFVTDKTSQIGRAHV